MRLHSRCLTGTDIRDAATYASASREGEVFLTVRAFKSRSHGTAYEVRLAGDGSVNRRRTNTGTTGASGGWESAYAASWSQWGHFLGYLFELDPAMRAGDYADAADFHRQTAGQFRYSPGASTRIVKAADVRAVVR